MKESDPSETEKMKRRIQVEEMARIIRRQSAAQNRGEVDREAYERALEYSSWLRPEELKEAERLAEEVDMIDPEAMVDDLMERLREEREE